MAMNSKAIIFCQAPIEVPNVLDLYFSISCKYNEITIVSINTDSYNKFFKYHNIKANFICINTLKPYTINWFFNLRKKIKEDLEKINLKNNDIYFTSRFDYNVALYLKYTDKSNKIYYRYNKDNIWRKCDNPKLKIKTILKFYLYKFATNTKIRIFPKGINSILPEIQLNNYNVNVSEWMDSQIKEEYLYKPKTHKKSIILFTEPYRNKFQTKEDYDNLNLKIVNFFQTQGFHVVMKGHPRIGDHPLLVNKVDEIIPNFIPSEFIDLKSYKLAIGFVSTSLCEAAKEIPTYSVLDMCMIKDNDEYLYWKNFLDGFKTPLIYLKTFNDIKIQNEQ